MYRIVSVLFFIFIFLFVFMKCTYRYSVPGLNIAADSLDSMMPEDGRGTRAPHANVCYIFIIAFVVSWPHFNLVAATTRTSMSSDGDGDLLKIISGDRDWYPLRMLHVAAAPALWYS